MDTIDSRNPNNLGTKMNDSEKDVEKSYVEQDHQLIKKNTRAIVLDKLTTR